MTIPQSKIVKYHTLGYSGGLAQNFPPAMVSSRGPYYLLTRKDSNVFLKKGAFVHGFEGGRWASPPLLG